MNKDSIKVIKRDAKNEEDKPQISANPLKTEHDRHRSMENTIRDWVSERRENNRAEKHFSDGKILAWKIIP